MNMNMNMNNEESIIDERLRRFFSDDGDDPFHVSRQVIDSFMNDYAYAYAYVSSSSEGEGGPLPLLSRCECHPCISDKDVNDDDRDHDDDHDSDIHMFFEPIYRTKTLAIDDAATASHPPAHPAGMDQKRKGQSFKLQIAYKGQEFCGWQIQPNNDTPSVQQTLIDRLDPLLNIDFDKPIDIRVCGRTDAGVSAYAQCCRVRTLRSEDEIGAAAIQQAINRPSMENTKGNCNNGMIMSPSPALLCTTVERVTDKFHPTFDAKSRGYLYLIDSEPLLAMVNEFQEHGHTVPIEDIVLLLNAMLNKLRGKELDYFALSFGKVKTTTTLCTLSRSRAFLVEARDGQRAVGIELVGDRFLRKMVRILSSTSIRELVQVFEKNKNGAGSGSNGPAIQQWTEDDECRLLMLVNERNRMHSAKAASSNGLMFVGARF